MAGLREGLDAAQGVVQVDEPRRCERHLGHVALVVEHDHALLAVGLEDAVVLALHGVRRTVVLHGHRELPHLVLDAGRLGRAALLEHAVRVDHRRRALHVALDVVRVGAFVDDEVVHLVYDQHRRAELLVKLSLDDLVEEAPVDAVLEAVDDLGIGVGEVVARLDAKLVVEGLVLRVVALEQPRVILEHVHAQPVELDHEDGQHGDHDRLALARRELRDEGLELQLRLLRLGRRGLAREMLLEELGHHEHGERLRVVRRERRGLLVHHELHPLGRDLREQLHVGLHRTGLARLRLGHELDELLRMVEEVDLGEHLGVVDARVPVRREGLLHEVRHDRLGLVGAPALLANRLGELLLGDLQRLAEHVLDHERDVRRLLEEPLPLGRRALRHVRL
mmetsp:Transcript_31796/g.83107  ORF Transcript_31796/g.83107 Transcript_31796/m.83107 type:complete len:393 (+) Transcript_31796:3287-4465(+)